MQKIVRFLSKTSVRMVAGYLLIVCLPISVFSMLYTRSMDERMQSEYASQKQQWVTRSASQLALKLQAIEKAHNTLQINRVFTDYLEKSAHAPQYVYDYIKYISFCLTDIMAIDAHIEHVKIYTHNLYLPRLKAEFVPLTFAFSEYRRGAWGYDLGAPGEANVLTYRRNLYDSRFADWLGVLEIAVNQDILTDYFDAVEHSQGYLLISRDRTILVDDGQTAAQLSDAQWEAVESGMKGGGMFMRLDGYTLNTVYIDSFDAYYVAVEAYPEGEMTEVPRRLQMLLLAGGLLAFSLFYYWIIAGQMRRIDRLSRHIRRVEEHNLAVIEGETQRDEVGYLYASYNAMILRIKELMKSLRQEQVMRQDAAYAALQAKVQPHFLYGTLETIRMLAVQNEDHGVAELTFAFGKLMRYSLGDSSRVTLGQEVENSRDYLIVKKMRMDDRLEYAIDLPEELAGVECPRFILQPVVENAVTHGIAKLLRKGIIEIIVRERENGFVAVVVRDNGIGLDGEQLARVCAAMNGGEVREQPHSPGNGFALYNVNGRLRQFYGPGCGLELKSAPDRGTVVTMIIRRRR